MSNQEFVPPKTERLGIKVDETIIGGFPATLYRDGEGFYFFKN